MYRASKKDRCSIMEYPKTPISKTEVSKVPEKIIFLYGYKIEFCLITLLIGANVVRSADI